MESSIRLVQAVVGVHPVDVSNLPPEARVELVLGIVSKSLAYLKYLGSSFPTLRNMMEPSDKDCDERFINECSNEIGITPERRCIIVYRLNEQEEGKALALRGYSMRERVRRSELVLSQEADLFVWDQEYRRALRPKMSRSVVIEEHSIRSRLWRPSRGEWCEIMTAAAAKAMIEKLLEIFDKSVEERRRRLDSIADFRSWLRRTRAQFQF